MLRRGVTLLLSLLLLSIAVANAQQSFVCTVCHKQVDHGYTVDGKFYCPLHLDQALPKCHNCGRAIQGDYVSVGPGNIPVCLTCRNSMPRCFLCSLPSDPNRGGITLKDGRALCDEHRRSGVIRQAQAREIFAQAEDQLATAFQGRLSLAIPIKDVVLVDLPGLKKAASLSGHNAGLSQGKILGITTISLVTQGTRKWLEPSVVHLLNFVPAERMLTVAGHEYAHVWHAENHQDYSSTQPILREGFAEWVAYKTAQYFHRTDQMLLMENPDGGIYYEGLRRFLELEKQRGVDGVLDYARHATTI